MADSASSSLDEEVVETRRRSRRAKKPKLSQDFHYQTDSPAPASASDSPGPAFDSDDETVQAVDEHDEPIQVVGIGRGGQRGRSGQRGRGGQRGGRVFRGRQYDEGEGWCNFMNRGVKKQITHMMTDDEMKEMLKEVAARQPAIILDIATILSRRQQQQQDPPADPPADPPVEQEVPAWCVCSHCPPMERDDDKYCCRMAPQHCNSLRPEMRLMITDPLTLHIQQTFRDDVFARQAESEEDTNAAFRHAAYRQYVLWVFGKLQKDDRRNVPACCVKIIRDKFPSLSGQYTGFRPARHGIGW